MKNCNRLARYGFATKQTSKKVSRGLPRFYISSSIGDLE